MQLSTCLHRTERYFCLEHVLGLAEISTGSWRALHLQKERNAVSLVSLALPELSERKHQPVQAEVQGASVAGSPSLFFLETGKHPMACMVTARGVLPGES